MREDAVVTTSAITPLPAAGSSPTLRLASADSINYAIISSDTTLSNPSWVKVIDALSEKHKNSKIFSFKEGKPEQVLLELKESAPKYTCFVAHHKEVTREWVSKIHQLTRNLDEDPYTLIQYGAFLQVMMLLMHLALQRPTSHLLLKGSLQERKLL